MRPRLLDLFCGAGGCSAGYARAGFEVVGVDINPQPNYPFTFHQADAMTYPLDGFDVIHASPPCQAYADAGASRKRADHPDLLDPVRQMLKATGKPYVIENVPLAPMPTGMLLCGSTFGLPIIRHRRFEIDPDPGLAPSLCHQTSHGHAVDHGPRFYPFARGYWEPAWLEHVLPVVWPWMTILEARQAIPPAYTEWIGAQILDQLTAAA